MSRKAVVVIIMAVIGHVGESVCIFMDDGGRKARKLCI
jgi:hypothetical protein